MDKLLKVKEFAELHNLLSGDKGTTNGISDVELQHLSWLGAQIPAGGDYVEIGSHRGKSICAVGCGVRAAGNHGKVRLFGVDLWTRGTAKSSKFAHYYSEETWRIFNDQVRYMQLDDVVRTVMDESTNAAKRRSRPIHLLFIDAAHDYKHVKADFDAWARFIPVGGRIAFHDFGTRFKGVDRVIREEVIASGLWAEGDVHDRIWSSVRVK
ncbi:MAG: class I SAM-dependent methyltransferase [Bryobacterales bacterium]|nr:class I SAM-dependent methyltransferase [Bryobacterales bacterium]